MTYANGVSSHTFEVSQGLLDVDVSGHAGFDFEDEASQSLRLEFNLYFRPGDDRLNEPGCQRMAMVARYLNRHLETTVVVDGHSDTRGTDAYNNVLAECRARAVAVALVVRGVSPDRIALRRSGGCSSGLALSDEKRYALDRRVGVRVMAPTHEGSTSIS